MVGDDRMIRPEDLVWRPSHQEPRPKVEVRSAAPKSISFRFQYQVADDIHDFVADERHDFQNARMLVADFWRLIADQDSRHDNFWTTESWKLLVVAGELQCHVEIMLQSNVEIEPQHVELGKKWLAQHADVS